MEALSTLRPAAALLEAFRFVLAHRYACLMRAVPVIMMAGLIAWAETNILADAKYFRLVMNDILYAIFAVYWHRYTLLPSERAARGFGLGFGLREIKYAGAMVGFAIVTYLLARIYTASGGGEARASLLLFIALLLLCYLPLMFIFPAIALDQPIRPLRFAQVVIDMFLPLLGVLLLGLVAVVGLYCLIYLPLLLLVLMQRPAAAGLLFYLLSSYLILPFVLAVSISFVSLLYRQAVGRVQVTPTDAPA